MTKTTSLIATLIFVIIGLSTFLVYYILQNREGAGVTSNANNVSAVVQQSVDPFLEFYKKVEKVCVESGGTYKGCPNCVEGKQCECSPCDCPEGMFIDYAIGCRLLTDKNQNTNR